VRRTVYSKNVIYWGFEMKEFLKVMKALSDPNRVRIVKMLQHKTMCVCEMQAALQIAQPSVSKHLRILEEADLVTHRKDGMWVNYRLSDGSSSPYVASLLGNLRHWLENDPDIAEIVNKLPDIRREDICRK
jgi:ArsR family transcriptional regulator